MAEVNPPFVVGGQSQPSTVFAEVLASLIAPPPALVLWGVLSDPTAPNGGGLIVTQRAAGANMSVDVAVGRALVPTANAQVAWHVRNGSVTNVAVAAANATNPRIDLIVARVYDTAVGDTGPSRWALEAVTGTAAPSPAAPAAPSNSVALAQVSVAAAATSVVNAGIADVRRRLGGLAGAVLFCTSTTRPALPWLGQTIDESDTGNRLVWYGSASGWRPPWSVSWGVLGRATVGTNQGSVLGTEVAITGLSVPVTIPQNRRLRARAHLDVSDTLANEHAAVVIRTAAGIVGRGEFDTSVVATFGLSAVAETPVLELAAGSYTFTVGLQRLSGSGTLTANGSVMASWLVVEDLGPNGAP